MKRENFVLDEWPVGFVHRHSARLIIRLPETFMRTLSLVSLITKAYSSQGLG